MERKHKIRGDGKGAEQSGMSMKGSKKGNSGGGSDDSSYEVEYIISEKKKNNKFYYFVKWVGYPQKDATWEPEDHLANCPEILVKFKMSQLNKEELDDMTQTLQREKDFQDCPGVPVLNGCQFDIEAVTRDHRQEEGRALERHVTRLLKESSETKDIKIKTVLNIVPPQSQEERVNYWVEVEGQLVPKKISRQNFLGNQVTEWKVIEFYEKNMVWK